MTPYVESQRNNGPFVKVYALEITHAGGWAGGWVRYSGPLANAPVLRTDGGFSRLFAKDGMLYEELRNSRGQLLIVVIEITFEDWAALEDRAVEYYQAP